MQKNNILKTYIRRKANIKIRSYLMVSVMKWNYFTIDHHRYNVTIINIIKFQ